MRCRHWLRLSRLHLIGTMQLCAPLHVGALSAREREICDLLLLGCSSAAIALRLDISRHTVKDHRKSIFRKLRVGSLAELFALRSRSR